MLKKIYVVFLFCVAKAAADFTPPIFDINFSPFAGAANFLALEQGIEKVESLLFPSTSISMEELKNPNQDLSFLNHEQFSRRMRNLIFLVAIKPCHGCHSA